MKRKNKRGAIMKLDFQKVYDLIRWSYLQNIIIKMRVGEKLNKWIVACVGTASLSNLVNGSPIIPIKMEKGLRLGIHCLHIKIELI